MLTAIDNWEIPEEKSASDHNIIKFNIKLEKDEEKKFLLGSNLL